MGKQLGIQSLNAIFMILKRSYQIKATQGITGFIFWLAHMKWRVWHLDVGLSCPKYGVSIIGGSAHPNTRYVSWVQNDVNQFGFYLVSHADLCTFSRDLSCCSSHSGFTWAPILACFGGHLGVLGGLRGHLGHHEGCDVVIECWIEHCNMIHEQECHSGIQ